MAILGEFIWVYVGLHKMATISEGAIGMSHRLKHILEP